MFNACLPLVHTHTGAPMPCDKLLGLLETRHFEEFCVLYFKPMLGLKQSHNTFWIRLIHIHAYWHQILRRFSLKASAATRICYAQHSVPMIS